MVNAGINEDIKEMMDSAISFGEECFTIADVYRRARELYNLKDFEFGERNIKAPNKLCLEHAVNVARWMPVIPHLDYTKYTTVTLSWNMNNFFLTMEFFPNRVRVLKVCADAPENSYESNQYHMGNIQVDMLFYALYQVSVEAGMPIDPQPKPWDEFEGVSIPDLDMDEIERRERATGEAFAKAFEEARKKREANGEYTILGEDEPSKA